MSAARHDMPPGGPRAILLDKDGVLVDFHRTWKPAIERAARAVATLATEHARTPEETEVLARRLLIDVGYEPRSDTFLPGSIWAAGTQEELFDTWAAALPALPRADIAETVCDILRAAEPHPVVAPEVLRHLLRDARRDGWKVAVLTNDFTESAVATTRRYGIAELLDAVIGADRCARPKPAPDLVHHAAAELNVPPGGMVMVGDNVHDGEMARRGGCAGFVGVLSGTSGETDLTPLADVVLADVAVALRWIMSAARQDRPPAPAAALPER